MPGEWFKDATPLVIWCRHCQLMVEMFTALPPPPECCPYCHRVENNADKWWTVERPEGKPVKGVLSDIDEDFLRCQRIEPWKGGVDTE